MPGPILANKFGSGPNPIGKKIVANTKKVTTRPLSPIWRKASLISRFINKKNFFIEQSVEPFDWQVKNYAG